MTTQRAKPLERLASAPIRRSRHAAAADNTSGFATSREPDIAPSPPSLSRVESAPAAEQALKAAEAICAHRHLRLTPMRHAVLKILCHSRLPLGAYDILGVLRRQLGNVAPMTVYRALSFLTSQSLVHRIDTLNAFVSCAQPDRPHPGQLLVCRDCGSVTEIVDARMLHRIAQLGRNSNFEVTDTVELKGRCGQCCARPE